MINIAKLLKDAPKGMKLYSPLFGEVKFKYINGSQFGIIVEDSAECSRSFDKYGRYFTIYNNAECLLFPSKECRTWENFELPVKSKFKVGDWVVTDYGKVSQVVSVDKDGDGYTLDDGVYFSGSWCDMYHLWTIQDAKDGDIMACSDWLFILKQFNVKGNNHKTYCHYDLTLNRFKDDIDSYMVSGSDEYHPATKEQRDLLFKKMKEAGYTWDEKKKVLKKIQPHYDIANFKPFDKVLVRDADDGKWRCNWFSHYSGDGGVYRFVTTKCRYAQCIPFEGNEHLLGTTDMCDKMYINW